MNVDNKVHEFSANKFPDFISFVSVQVANVRTISVTCLYLTFPCNVTDTESTIVREDTDQTPQFASHFDTGLTLFNFLLLLDYWTHTLYSKTCVRQPPSRLTLYNG